MKIERQKGESEAEWAERLAEAVTMANNTEISKYFVERDPYHEDAIIINYIEEDGWTWKEHPEGSFTAKQIIEWKNRSAKFDKLLPSLEYLALHADAVINILESSELS